LACILAAMVTQSVCGQELNTPYPDGDRPAAAQASLSDAVPTSAYEADASADFQKQLADMKKDLQKLTDKAAADKKKAESAPSITVGGRMQWDTAAFSQNALSKASIGDAVNGVEARRMRLVARGDAFFNTDYKLEMDFASTSRPTVKDVFFTVKELPYLQNVRIGHFKEPFGLEQLTSSSYLTFMERSLCDEGFIVPGRNTGIMTFGCTESERATYAIGAFVTDMVDNPPLFGRNGVPGTAPSVLPSGVTNYDDQPQASATMRATCLPWYDEATQGRGLWHAGIAYSYRATEGYLNGAGQSVVANYQVRPEAHLAPVILSTSGLRAVDTQIMGVETAFVYGPFSAQAEYFYDYVDRPAAAGLSDVTFSGCYVYVSYFLTGENRPYNRKLGYFDRVKPFTNFFRVRTCDNDVQTGWGAWELAYRWSYADMLDGIPAAQRTVGMGRASDQTVGLNWYLNPYCRLMWNYVLTDFDRVQTAGAAPITGQTMNTFEMRGQFDF
jgi:phosphate-selective porin OprO/OprP